MPIAGQKCFSLGSPVRLAKKLSEALGGYGGSSGCSARQLGVDHAFAVGKKVRRVRCRKYKARSKRTWSVVALAGIKVSPLRIYAREPCRQLCVKRSLHRGLRR